MIRCVTFVVIFTFVDSVLGQILVGSEAILLGVWFCLMRNDRLMYVMHTQVLLFFRLIHHLSYYVSVLSLTRLGSVLLSNEMRVPPWSNFYHVGSHITTTWVQISAWAYLKGVSYLTSLHYLWGLLSPFSLAKWAIKHQSSSQIL